MPIYVTKPFLPPLEEYNQCIKHIFDNGILTNGGPFVKELNKRISKFLGVNHFEYVTNGTVALQLAIRALGIENGEIITTPFSYVATTTSILWERCTPVFVDIEPNNFTMDINKIEAAITPQTRAIMPVHVFGYACDVDKIQKIADKHNLKVIYDGAHAFASKYKGKSLLDYGDISTCSFHATKLFHTIEGGACICKDKKISEELSLMMKFGHNADDYFCIGINGKQDEFNAAMGLLNLKHLSEIIEKRKHICEKYDALLAGLLQRPKKQADLEYNYAYYPVVFKTEEELLRVFAALAKEDIHPRRYFYPSLNTLPYLKTTQSCPISEDISKRIACLPLYTSLQDKEVNRICEIIFSEIHRLRKVA